MIKVLTAVLCTLIVNVSSFALYPVASVTGSLDRVSQNPRVRASFSGVLQLKAEVSRRELLVGLSSFLLVPSSALAVRKFPFLIALEIGNLYARNLYAFHCCELMVMSLSGKGQDWANECVHW